MPIASLRCRIIVSLVALMLPSAVAAQVDPTPEDAQLGIHGEYLPESFLEALRRHVSQGHWIRTIAFPEWQDAWVFVFENNGLVRENIPPAMEEALMRANRNKERISHIAFQGSEQWAVVVGDNGYTEHGTPDGMKAELRRINRAGGTIGAIALTGDDEWFIVQSGASQAGSVDTDIAQALRETGENCWPQIRFLVQAWDGSWLFICSGNGYKQNGIPDAMVEAIEEIRARRNWIEAVAFTPDGGWVVVEDR